MNITSDAIAAALVKRGELFHLTVAELNDLADALAKDLATDPLTIIRRTNPDTPNLLMQGKKIEAIKQVKHSNGWGLKESKEAVEAWQDLLPPRTA